MKITKTSAKLYYIIYIVIAIGVFLNATVNVVYAKTQENTDEEISADALMLSELINEARQHPLAVANSLGMKTKQILSDNADIAEVLKNGLPALKSNKNLQRSASVHTTDMLENNYYSYVSIKGDTVAERMQQNGYVPASTGESLGLVFFNNFISTDNAVMWIFENMFKDELAPEGSGIRKILNPNIQEFGICMKGGRFSIESFNANVYMAVCDFGRQAEIYEMQLLNLINQLRATPIPVLEAYGIEPELDFFPEYTLLLLKGLAPIKYNASLYMAAEDLALDMFENEHFTATTVDGRSIEDRVTDAGYEAVWVDESRYRVTTCDEIVSPADTVSQMFRYLVNRAFRADPDNRHSAMLNPWIKDSGIRIMAGQSAALGGICGDSLHIMVADFGTPTSSEFENGLPDKDNNLDLTHGSLIGVVFEDKNTNGLYDIGEACPDAFITVDKGDNSDIQNQYLTNAAGGYEIDLEPGRYRLCVTDGAIKKTVQWIDIESNSAVWFPIVNDITGTVTEN